MRNREKRRAWRATKHGRLTEEQERELLRLTTSAVGEVDAFAKILARERLAVSALGVALGSVTDELSAAYRKIESRLAALSAPPSSTLVEYGPEFALCRLAWDGKNLRWNGELLLCCTRAIRIVAAEFVDDLYEDPS